LSDGKIVKKAMPGREKRLGEARMIKTPHKKERRTFLNQGPGLAPKREKTGKKGARGKRVKIIQNGEGQREEELSTRPLISAGPRGQRPLACKKREKKEKKPSGESKEASGKKMKKLAGTLSILKPVVGRSTTGP